MRYFARSKFSRSLVRKKNFGFIRQADTTSSLQFRVMHNSEETERVNTKNILRILFYENELKDELKLILIISRK